jgi:hypothetical protein
MSGGTSWLRTPRELDIDPILARAEKAALGDLFLTGGEDLWARGNTGRYKWIFQVAGSSSLRPVDGWSFLLTVADLDPSFIGLSLLWTRKVACTCGVGQVMDHESQLTLGRSTRGWLRTSEGWICAKL